MSGKNEERRDEPVLGDDLLYGADAVAKYIKRKRRFVYHQQENLGLKHVGGTLVGSKTKLTKLFTA
jgi:hypothetical protein